MIRRAISHGVSWAIERASFRVLYRNGESEHYGTSRDRVTVSHADRIQRGISNVRVIPS
jgi:hypothetical protein